MCDNLQPEQEEEVEIRRISYPSRLVDSIRKTNLNQP